MAAVCALDSMSSELVLSILSYLSALDSGRATLCRRVTYLLDNLSRLDPELVAMGDTIGSEHRTVSATLEGALANMRSRPNIAWVFYSTELGHKKWTDAAEALLPPDTVVLAAQSEDIQANVGHCVTSNEHFSVMLANFPEAMAVPFHFSTAQVSKDMEQLLQQNAPGSAADYWKVFIVYVSGEQGNALAEKFIADLQSAHPHAVILGGVCSAGDVRASPVNNLQKQKPLSQMRARDLKRLVISQLGKGALKGVVDKAELLVKANEAQAKQKDIAGRGISILHTSNGIYGMALGGNVPLRSVVSRGVRSLISGEVAGSPEFCASDSWQVDELQVLCPGDEDYPYMVGPWRQELKPVMRIRSVKSSPASALVKNMGVFDFLTQTFAGGCRPEFIGLKIRTHDGFKLHAIHSRSICNRCLMLDLPSDATLTDVQGAHIDIFALDGEACIQDVDLTLQKLKLQLVDEELLGGLMFSCCGRGPCKGLVGEAMMDATHFEKAFPGLPCLGFYAGGEIGPPAIAGNAGNVFQRGQVAFQGFTVVFGVFVVPTPSIERYKLDDSAENIVTHMYSHYSSAKRRKTSGCTDHS